MKRQVVSAVFGLVVACGPVFAEGPATPGIVVELYTSQGCSSCPPADEYLKRLAETPGVIALALHVDYWDYIGWTDKFGNPRNTARQKAYAHAVGSNTIYTPQMIVGGVDRVEGSDPAMVEAAIRRHQSSAPTVELHLTRKAGQVVIGAEASPLLSAPVHVQMVRYHPLAKVQIENGENAGRTMDYANIVTAWSVLGEWDGKSNLNLTAAAEGEDAVVVILQAEGPGEIVAASSLK